MCRHEDRVRGATATVGTSPRCGYGVKDCGPGGMPVLDPGLAAGKGMQDLVAAPKMSVKAGEPDMLARTVVPTRRNRPNADCGKAGFEDGRRGRRSVTPVIGL
jgi:hypothetical protein